MFKNIKVIVSIPSRKRDNSSQGWRIINFKFDTSINHLNISDKKIDHDRTNPGGHFEFTWHIE